jgi:hypothetical protein
MKQLRNWAAPVAFLSLLAMPLCATSQSVSVTQSPNGHIIANVSDTLPQGCLANPTFSVPSSPPFFAVYTNIECPPPDALALYTASVDLGLVADGDYTVRWVFILGGFGPVGTAITQPFSVRNGLLVVNAPAAIPSLSDFAPLMLALLVALIAFRHFRALRVVN